MLFWLYGSSTNDYHPQDLLFLTSGAKGENGSMWSIGVLNSNYDKDYVPSVVHRDIPYSTLCL